jgi:hypothetical protein
MATSGLGTEIVGVIDKLQESKERRTWMDFDFSRRARPERATSTLNKSHQACSHERTIGVLTKVNLM